MKKLIAGNWKMNGSLEQGRALAAKIVENIGDLDRSCDFLICPPSLYVQNIHDVCAHSAIAVGAQDCSAYESGAYTGEIAAPMIRDCGGAYVILGHSERREYHGETDEQVAAKARAAYAAGLTAIICVGETEAEREADAQEEVVGRQLAHSIPQNADAHNTVVAYEPVWAIGTGKTASPADVETMHTFIREKLKTQLAGGENIRILYGGSMKPDNAELLLSTPNVDGGLIGGASLNAEQFIAIAQCAPKAG